MLHIYFYNSNINFPRHFNELTPPRNIVLAEVSRLQVAIYQSRYLVVLKQDST